jgi:hypothetical protein
MPTTIKAPSSAILDSYANKFRVDAEGDEMRILFGNTDVGGMVTVHTIMILSTSNAIELGELILRSASSAPQSPIIFN